jgi:hypothetical protein
MLLTGWQVASNKKASAREDNQRTFSVGNQSNSSEKHGFQGYTEYLSRGRRFVPQMEAVVQQ